MKNKNNALQNQIAKESIFTALMILMEQKSFKEITITELTVKAGVSRMAFYRNYTQMEDVITNYLMEYLEDYSSQILNKESFNAYESARLYFACFRKQEKLITNLIHSNLTNLIFESNIEFFHTFFKNICERACSSTKQKYYAEFIAGGLYKVLIEWAKNGMIEGDEDMAGFINTLNISKAVTIA
ncbi:MAG: TetR/AcrR family transcriptional regulator [Mobilitalea sp.]